MVFSFLKQTKQEGVNVLLIDVGSASVGAALVRLEKGKSPHILLTAREDMLITETLSSVRFLSSMNHALERVLKKIQSERKDFSVPAQAFCTLSSPWFILRTRNLRVREKEPFEVSDKTLEGFLNKDIENLKAEFSGTLPLQDLEVIERKIISMKLNGYEVQNPYGQTTSQIEIVATVGLSSKKVTQGITHKVNQFFHTPNIHFGAFPTAAFSMIRDMFPQEQNFIFLDITGEATDVSLILKDLLVSTTSFSMGKNFFVRNLAVNLKTVYAEASTLLGMFLRDELKERERGRIGNLLVHSRLEWIARFTKTLESFASMGVVPHRIFFTSDADSSQLFMGLIRATKVAGVASEPETTYLTQAFTDNFVSFEPKVLRDPFLAIEALLIAKITKDLIK